MLALLKYAVSTKLSAHREGITATSLGYHRVDEITALLVRLTAAEPHSGILGGLTQPVIDPALQVVGFAQPDKAIRAMHDLIKYNPVVQKHIVQGGTEWQAMADNCGVFQRAEPIDLHVQQLLKENGVSEKSLEPYTAHEAEAPTAPSTDSSSQPIVMRPPIIRVTGAVPNTGPTVEQQITVLDTQLYQSRTILPQHAFSEETHDDVNLFYGLKAGVVRIHGGIVRFGRSIATCWHTQHFSRSMQSAIKPDMSIV